MRKALGVLLGITALGMPGVGADVEIIPARDDRRRSERSAEHSAMGRAKRRPKRSKGERRLARAAAKLNRPGRQGFRPSWMRKDKVP